MPCVKIALPHSSTRPPSSLSRLLRTSWPFLRLFDHLQPFFFLFVYIYALASFSISHLADRHLGAVSFPHPSSSPSIAFLYEFYVTMCLGVSPCVCLWLFTTCVCVCVGEADVLEWFVVLISFLFPFFLPFSSSLSCLSTLSHQYLVCAVLLYNIWLNDAHDAVTYALSLCLVTATGIDEQLSQREENKQARWWNDRNVHSRHRILQRRNRGRRIWHGCQWWRPM